MMTLAVGDAVQALRSVMRGPEQKGVLGVMPEWLPGWLPGAGVMGLKAVSVFSGNHAKGLESHTGAALLYETAHGLRRAHTSMPSVRASPLPANSIRRRWLRRACSSIGRKARSTRRATVW